jgi:hypothetical protein
MKDALQLHTACLCNRLPFPQDFTKYQEVVRCLEDICGKDNSLQTSDPQAQTTLLLSSVAKELHRRLIS